MSDCRLIKVYDQLRSLETLVEDGPEVPAEVKAQDEVRAALTFDLPTIRAYYERDLESAPYYPFAPEEAE